MKSEVRSIYEKRWAVIAIVSGILVGFVSAYLCIIYYLVIFGFNIMYIISPLLAGIVETVIARRKYGRSTGAISALITFILINVYGWILPGTLVDPTKEPASLSLITIIAIILTFQAAFPTFINYLLLVIGLGFIRKIIAFLVYLPSRIRGIANVAAVETTGPSPDEEFMDSLETPLVSVPEMAIGKIKKSVGLVMGEAVAPEEESDGMISKLAKINEPPIISDYNLGEARKLAISRMLENAQEMGADTVIEIFIDYVSMGGLQGSALIVTATGTAVIYK